MKSKFFVGIAMSLLTASALTLTSCGDDDESSIFYSSYFDGTYSASTLNLTIDGTAVSGATVTASYTDNTLSLSMKDVPGFKDNTVVTTSVDEATGNFVGTVTDNSSVVYDVTAGYSDIYGENKSLNMILTKQGDEQE